MYYCTVIQCSLQTSSIYQPRLFCLTNVDRSVQSMNVIKVEMLGVVIVCNTVDIVNDDGQIKVSKKCGLAKINQFRRKKRAGE